MGCTNSVPSIDLVVKDEGDASAAGWKKYIETQLVGESGCAEAFILGLNGELWAKSAGISIKAATTVTVMTETQKKVSVDARAAGPDLRLQCRRHDAHACVRLRVYEPSPA